VSTAVKRYQTFLATSFVLNYNNLYFRTWEYNSRCKNEKAAEQIEKCQEKLKMLLNELKGSCANSQAEYIN